MNNNLPYINEQHPDKQRVKEYKEFLKKTDFYVCLCLLNKSKDKFNRCLKPTKIKYIDENNFKLIPHKGKPFSYNSSIYWFDTYEECAIHFNKQIDEQSQHIKEQLKKIKKKYNQMINMKVNIREQKLKNILKTF